MGRGGKMKVGMLLLVFSFSTVVYGKGTDFNQLIEESRSEGEQVNAAVVEQMPQSEVSQTYLANWRRLRARKQTAVAQIDLKLKASVQKKALVAGNGE